MDKLKQWHETKGGLAVFGLVELALAYGFISLSIDRGNFWWYLLTLIFTAGSVKNLATLVRKLSHGRSKAS